VTHLKPYHLGELIVHAMFERTNDRLGNFRPTNATQALGESLAAAGLVAPFSFSSDAPSVRVEDAMGNVWALDGMHRVDVLATGTSGVGVAIELKLGLDRLTSGEGGQSGRPWAKAQGQRAHPSTTLVDQSMLLSAGVRHRQTGSSVRTMGSDCIRKATFRISGGPSFASGLTGMWEMGSNHAMHRTANSRLRPLLAARDRGRFCVS
jgi:hypothetical protein